jgi:tetratricopeptide (TPR) repeat protein
MNHANTNRKRLLATVAPAAVLLGLWAGWGSVSRWIEQRASELAPPTPTLGSDIALQNRLIGALRSAAGDRGKAGDWTGAIRLVDQVCTPRQCPPALRELRAEAYLRTGDKPRAQSDFKELLGGRIPPDPNRMSRMPGMALIDTGAADPIAKGLFLALVGDTVGYAAHRTDVSRRTVGNTLSALDANNTAWACAYLPGDPADFKIALGLARSAVDRAEPDSKPTYLNTLGVLQVRAGRHADALRSLNEAEKLESEPANWPFLALAHDALGHPDDARRWADKLDRHLRVTFGRDTSNRRELLLFHGEIQRLLAGGAGKKNP